MNSSLARDVMQCARGVFSQKTTNKLYGDVREVRPEMMTADQIDSDYNDMVLEQFRTDKGYVVTDDDRKRELAKAIRRYDTRTESKLSDLRGKNPNLPTAFRRRSEEH